MANLRMIDDAAVADDRVIDLRAVDLGAGQKAGTGKNGRDHVEEIETGQLGGDIEICLEEGANGADVLPVTLVDVGKDALLGDGAGMCVVSEVGVDCGE